MSLKDNVAIITGAGQGIGRAYALGFAENGAKVVVADIVLENAEKVVNEIEVQGGTALALRTDVSDEASANEMADKTLEKFGAVDILVNNAAVYSGIGWRAWDSWKKEEWDRMFAVNVTGSWLCAKAVGPHMVSKKKGKIINISSSTVQHGMPGFVPYTCTKAALVALTRTLAASLGRYNINVNCIVPGFTMSEASREMPGISSEGAKGSVNVRAIRREERPEDLVGTALFLASEGSDFITGQSIIVDGGAVFQ
jgi:3-oxoacyl-[acyl-carrier protein] reductase